MIHSGILHLRVITSPVSSLPLTYNSREDQTKIRRALASRRVDPTDVPDSAKLSEPVAINRVSVPASVPGPKKRKAAQELLSTAGSSSSQVSKSSKSVSAPVIDISDEEASEPEVIDELYCVLDSQVVGVRYYNGMVGAGEEIRLVRDPHNQYDG